MDGLSEWAVSQQVGVGSSAAPAATKREIRAHKQARGWINVQALGRLRTT